MLTLARMQLIIQSRAEDKKRLGEMDERAKDKRYGRISAAMCETIRPKPAPTVIPEGQLVVKASPGVARGLEAPRMRAKGDGGNYRGPGAMTLAEKRRLLAKYEKGLSPDQFKRAKAALGL